MLCRLKEAETSGKALQVVAFGMSIGRGGWQWQCQYFRQNRQKEYTGSALFMEKGLCEEQDMCRAIVVEKPVRV